MRRNLALLLAAALLCPGEAWLASGVRRRGPSVERVSSRAASVRAAEGDDGPVFTFGDAAPVSASTEQAMAEEEQELTEKQKEIARLKAAEKFMLRETGDAVCRTCNYKYKMEEGAPMAPKLTPFDLLPESWACPNCKSPKAFFDPIQIEIAGFADNQEYGFGTNTWTEGQKSNLIFGGLGFFFLLLMGGYALN